MRIVLDNLLGNARKHSGRRGAPVIEFPVEARQGSPYQQRHSQAEFEGTGIGLATVRRISTRYGGHVWAASVPGREATFYFSLGRVGPDLKAECQS